jgi:hypothetical protein
MEIKSLFKTIVYAYGLTAIELSINTHNTQRNIAKIMPTISIFYGILIQMFFDDHTPPHFHARYAEHRAQINIQTLEIIEGNLPGTALSLVRQWANEHQTELMENWKLCVQMQLPKKIAPLP